MSTRLPDLAKLDYTSLDYDSIITLVNDLIKNHPDYFSNVDDFLSSNAGRMTIEVVAFVLSILTDRIDWIANETQLPTATQKSDIMNILKLINYRLKLPTTSACTVRASINAFVDPFAIPSRYTVPATDLDGNRIYFELLNKDENNKYIYEGTNSSYEFNTGYEASPTLRHDDLVFYEGRSYRELFQMKGLDNEFVKLSKNNIEEGSIRAWKISRDNNGNIISKKELTEITSFISPEAQDASDINLPPFKIQNTESNSAYLVFGESSVVSTFNPNGLDEIMVWYRVTSGSVGNITTSSINFATNIIAAGQSIQIAFINITSGSGGAESETIDHAKRYAPLSLTTVEKTVNPNDFVVLLQENPMIMNSITYGKSNEPSELHNDYGYYIPPFESWIYPVVNKLGWESFNTYSYPISMRVGRPYTMYGPREKEYVTFSINEQEIELLKLKYNAHNNEYTNIRVSDYWHKIIYVPGQDYVIDLKARTIIRLSGGGILESDTILIQYYENSNQDEYVKINFATGDEQDIPKVQVYPGERTYAWSLDTNTVFNENNLSTNDYDFPNNDYIIDYLNGKIKRNSVYPFIESKYTIYESTDVGTFPYSNTTPSVGIKSGINNEIIISLSGLNRSVLNANHDFKIGCYSGWATVGEGQDLEFSSGSYSFKMAIDGGEYVEYVFDPSGPTTKTVIELVDIIKTTCTPAFPTSEVEIFADYFHYEASPKLTFMSKNTGINSRIQLEDGVTGTSLFDVANAIPVMDEKTGEDIDIIELALRCRETLNGLGLCNSYSGKKLSSNREEYPEVYSRTNLSTPNAFAMDGTHKVLKFTLTGTQGGIYNGTTEVTFTNVVANSPYDLRTMQGIIDLVKDMQLDIDGSDGFDAQDVVKVIWLKEDGNYRIGFQLTNNDWNSSPSIIISDGTSNSCRGLLKIANGQCSADKNLVEVETSTNSDMVNNHYLRFSLYGAYGRDAKIQVLANNSIHNNTLNLMQLGDNQFSKGTGILSNTLIGEKDWLGAENGTYTFTTANNKFTLTLTGIIVNGDADYVITIPAAEYNIEELVTIINTAFTTSSKEGTPTNISNYLICEKIEGKDRIRIRTLTYNIDSTNPDVSINDNDDATINKKCIDILGFIVGRSMSDYSTIILHYNGDWISDAEADQSESTTIIKSLKNNRLIHQDYIIIDPVLTSFDVKGTIYVEKGYDREIIKSQVNQKIKEIFTIDKREFAQNLTASSIIDAVKSVEGVDSLVIDYLGKDYQLYKKYIDEDKHSTIIANLPAENVKARWKTTSAFKITLDGCTVDNINYDGEYLVVVGNGWTDRDYNSLLNYIKIGNGSGACGLRNAISLRMGEGIIDLNNAITVTHSNGIFKFTSVNEGSNVMIKLESPTQILTKGYQTFNRTTNIIEGEANYTNNVDYKIKVAINGAAGVDYTIHSPSSGDWPLYQIASLLETALPSTVIVGIDKGNKIRITSLLGGYASTISITSPSSGNNLLDLIGPADTRIDGTAGYSDCLTSTINGTLNIGSPVIKYGIAEEPTESEYEEMYNYRNSIPASYNEIIYLSDDYFLSGSNLIAAQVHGIIITYLETGK